MPPTLECLIRALIPVLVRMCQQTQLPVRLLDLAIATCRPHFLETQYVVEICRFAALDSYHRRLLLHCECAPFATIIVWSMRTTIGLRALFLGHRAGDVCAMRTNAVVEGSDGGGSRWRRIDGGPAMLRFEGLSKHSPSPSI